jgi:hypothetical protein
MLSAAVAAISLGFFFCIVLYFCVRDRGQNARAAWDANIEIMRKSPFGRWRY